MLSAIGCGSLEDLARETVPEAIRLSEPLALPGLEGRSPGEHGLLEELRLLADSNEVKRSCIGMGYADTIVPPVLQRNILENPGWYTQYTPYQAEISQGRLEALLNFQTMVADLTGLPLANASLLDEATAAAEAMSMCRGIVRKGNRFVVAEDCHPQTISVVRTRGDSLGLEIEIRPTSEMDFEAGRDCGVLLQYPTTDGRVEDYRDLVARAHAAGARVVVAADLLAPFVSERNEWIVRHHGVFQGYYYFHHYGQDRNARDRYRGHEHYDACVEFCARWDQFSFDPDYETLPLEYFEPLVRAVFAREPRPHF